MNDYPMRRVPFEPRPHTFTDDAEVEIRRQVTRHHNQLAEIAELKTDRDMYKQRTEVAEAEITLLLQKQRDLEARVEELQAICTTLKTNFDTGAEIWLKSYDVLKRVEPKAITPPQIEKLGSHDDDHH